MDHFPIPAGVDERAVAQNDSRVGPTGNSQAIRLPKAFRVNVREMWISKNDVTGEITLKPKNEDQRQRNLVELLRLVKESPFSENFIPPRLPRE